MEEDTGNYRHVGLEKDSQRRAAMEHSNVRVSG